MTNSSTVAGYLTPTTSILVGDALTDFFSAVVVGITGLPGSMVRPRWQPEAPDIPAWGTDWCGIGVITQIQDAYAAELPHADGLGTELRRHEILTILASFYGPNGNSYASLFGHGLQIDQNREVFSLNSMGFVEAEEIVTTPELIKERWLPRFDLKFRIKRQVVLEYNVLSLLSASGQLITDNPNRTINIKTP